MYLLVTLILFVSEPFAGLQGKQLVMNSPLVGESGACCYQSGDKYFCQDIPGPEGQNLCEMIFQGVWQGAGSDCLSTDCYSGIYGACCIEDFKYYCEEELTQEECEWNFGGTFLGPDSTCAIEGDYCQSDVGACCIDFYD